MRGDTAVALTIRRRKAKLTVAIEGKATIVEAEQLRDELAKCIETWDRVQLDLGLVTDIDTAGMQVLLSAAVTAASEGKPLAIGKTSEAVVDTCRLMGLENAPPFTAMSR
ncbi:MAG TPA: hypothetical protein DGT21_19940 [Armatimonadetes bacterium]|nr:hypothetical protein [Armatimonadota bacterium]